jgi:hypothetical protein
MLVARVYPALKADLERACERSGKTLSDEIEERLRRSFSKREDAFGDNTTRYFALLVARLATKIQRYLGVSWRNDRWAFDALAEGIPALLSMMAPLGEPKVPEGHAARLRDLDDRGGWRKEYADMLRTPMHLGVHMAFQLRESAVGDMKELAEASPHDYDMPIAGREVGMGASEWEINDDGDDK